MVGYVLPDVSVDEDGLKEAGRTGTSAGDLESSAKVSRMGKVLRLIKITKLLRIARIQRALAKLNVEIGPPLKIFALIGMTCLGFHLLSCLWFFIGSQTEHGWTHDSPFLGDGSDAGGGDGMTDNPGYNPTDFYYEAMFRAVFGTIFNPTSGEMMGLVANHLLINGPISPGR
jgi:hypothetical protein